MSKILALQMLAAGGDLVAAESTSSVNCFAGDSFNSNCSVNCGGKTIIEPVDTTVAL